LTPATDARLLRMNGSNAVEPAFEEPLLDHEKRLTKLEEQ
jgi:hypothetical protein